MVQSSVLKAHGSELKAHGSELAALCVRDWSGILFSRRRRRSGKRYSGKPDGRAGTPKIETQNLRT